MALIHNDDYYYNVVRKNIRKYREIKKLTQAQLAEKANMSYDYLTEIESEKRKKSFSLAILGKIADTLEIPITKFFEEN